MKLLLPLNEDCDVAELSHYSDEFYMGVHDEAWENQRIGEYNARGFSKQSNFSCWQTLERAIEIATQSNIPCYLTVNAHNIGSTGIAIAKRIIEHFRNIGGMGVISSNLDILQYTKRQQMMAIVSTVGGVYNEAAIRMICELVQPERIVLHRDMTFDSIRCLREKFHNVEFEVFGAFFGCKYSNAYCYCKHDRETGGMCRMTQLSEWSFQNRFRELNSQMRFEIEKNHWLYANYLFDGACGVCALYHLTKIGIDSIKVVGRELSGAAILKASKGLAGYLQLASHAQSEQEYFAQIGRNPVGAGHLGCFGGYSCYYPEISNRALWK